MKAYAWLMAAALSMITAQLDAAPARITVLTPDAKHQLDAELEGEAVWLPSAQLKALTGLELRAEGLCGGGVCIPVAKDAPWLRGDADGRAFDLRGLARQLDIALALEAPAGVYSIGAVPAVQQREATDRRAPDFALKDRAGKTVRLSDFRGKKVLLLSWASW
jgi:hypothetical protein